LARPDTFLDGSLPFFEIAVVTADRKKSLAKLLRSIQSELAAFGYPSEKVRVHLFNDGKSALDGFDMGGMAYVVKVWEVRDQIAFIREHYNIAAIAGFSHGYVHGFPKDTPGVPPIFHRGSTMTANVAKMILAKFGDSQDLVWFLDDDEEFAILHKDVSRFNIIPHAFSAFHAYAYAFRDASTNIATGKCVGDPPFSSNQFIRTTIFDRAMGAVVESKNGDYYNEHLAYLDVDLIPRSATSELYDTGYPSLPYYENGVLSHHPIHTVLFGHAISRPITYHPKRYGCTTWGDIDRNLGETKFLYPGNIVYRRNKLGLLCPFADKKLRMNGAVFGHFLADAGEIVKAVFIPIFHRRLPDVFDPYSEFRVGVEDYGGITDISGSWIKQMEGYVLLEIFRDSANFTNGTSATVDRSFKRVSDVHGQNLAKISEIVSLLRGRAADMADSSLRYLLDSIELSIHKMGPLDKERIRNDMDVISRDLKAVKNCFDQFRQIVSSGLFRN